MNRKHALSVLNRLAVRNASQIIRLEQVGPSRSRAPGKKLSICALQHDHGKLPFRIGGFGL
jgi:hypothetical protein